MDNIIEDDCRKILRRINIGKVKKKKVLITGANGFFGQYIVGALSLANREMGLECKIDAVSLNKPNPFLAYIINHDKNISYRRVDLSKNFYLNGYDLIFHAAGYGQPAKFINDSYSTIAININATKKLIQGSPEATFVFFSSGEIYGDIPKKLIPVDENYNGNCPLFLPRSVYAEAKRLGEALCAMHARDFGTKIKIVRISLAYGPGLPLSDTRVMSNFIKKAIEEKKINLLDSGKAIKSYGYISDTVSMILFIAFQGKDMVYNVGGENRISILDLAKKISKYCKVKYQTPSNTSDLAHIGKDPKIIKLNLNKVTSEMKGFKFTPFNEGLARTIEWQKELYKKTKI